MRALKISREHIWAGRPCHVWSIMLVLGVCVTAGLADELKLKKVPAYPTPTITGYADGMVTFRTQTTSGSKSLADVDVIKLAGQEAFNKAEDLFDKGDFAGAAKGFDSVPEAADRPWLAKLAKGRRLQSLGQAGMIEQAAKEWMAQLVAAKGASPVFAMMPKKFGAKGSAENKAAIVLLEKQIAASKDASVVSSLKQLLSGVYEAQGDSAKAAALREADDAGQATSGPDKEPAAQESAGPTVTIGLAQLKAYEGLVQNNKGADVVGHLTPPALRSLSSPSDLAMALLILGKAQLQVAKGVTVKDDNALADRNDKLRQAGVSFMRVAVFSSNSPDQATEALFCAGEVCSLMGDQDAATRAYETIVQNYQETDSPKAMEFVKKAQAILGKAK